MKNRVLQKAVLTILSVTVVFALQSFTAEILSGNFKTVEKKNPVSAKSVWADTVPDDFPEITVNVDDNPSPGMIFLSNFALEAGVNPTPYLMILKEDGTPFFYRKMESKLNLDFKMHPNGLYTYFDFDRKKFYGMDSNFMVIDSFACSANYTGDEHELRLLENGNYLLLANDIRQINMAQIVPGGKPNAKVIGFVIQEINPSGEVVFEWNTFDHFEITDATEGIDLTGFVVDYVHCNAVETDYDGNLLLSSRYFDEITKIDRTTGEIIWRMGGKMCKNNEFKFVNDSTADFFGFSHQHAIRRLPNGHITLMDNGNLKNPQFSRAVEYELDEENKIATLVWQFRHTPDIYTNSMGYVQRLDNGNTLIGWGENENSVAATEVTPEGKVVYELSLPQKQYSYRACKFNLLHTGVREFENNISVVKIYPNPFRLGTSVSFHLEKAEHLSVSVYSLSGKEVVKLSEGNQPAGDVRVFWDGKGASGELQPAGSYFVVIKAGNQMIKKKIIKAF